MVTKQSQQKLQLNSLAFQIDDNVKHGEKNFNTFSWNYIHMLYHESYNTISEKTLKIGLLCIFPFHYVCQIYLLGNYTDRKRVIIIHQKLFD